MTATPYGGPWPRRDARTVGRRPTRTGSMGRRRRPHLPLPSRPTRSRSSTPHNAFRTQHHYTTREGGVKVQCHTQLLDEDPDR